MAVTTMHPLVNQNDSLAELCSMHSVEKRFHVGWPSVTTTEREK
jgi:hypothetical protein